jgi:hypothetical protein
MIAIMKAMMEIWRVVRIEKIKNKKIKLSINMRLDKKSL